MDSNNVLFQLEIKFGVKLLHILGYWPFKNIKLYFDYQNLTVSLRQQRQMTYSSWWSKFVKHCMTNQFNIFFICMNNGSAYSFFPIMTIFCWFSLDYEGCLFILDLQQLFCCSIIYSFIIYLSFCLQLDTDNSLLFFLSYFPFNIDYFSMVSLFFKVYLLAL